MKRLLVMIGLPGSGKSTVASQIKANDATDKTLIVSTDAIRGELYGSESEQGDPNKVFSIAKTRMIDALNGNYDTVIFDATNLRKKYRIPFIKEMRQKVNTEFEIVAFWVAVPYQECLRRDKGRSRKVGEFVIRRMYLNFAPPGYEEGFDDILINTPDRVEDCMREYTVDRFFEKAMPFEQHNKHHTLTLGAHCMSAFDYVKERCDDEVVCLAAMLHDNGKIFTASFKDHNGNITEECHFYQHHCVGAYDSVFYATEYGNERKTYLANLIYFHMHPLLNWKNNEKKMEKDLANAPKQFKENLMLLHEADVQAH